MAQGTQPAIGSVVGKSTSKAGAFNLGSARRICFTMEGIEFQGLTHGDDFVLTGPTKRLTVFENRMTGFFQSKQKSSVPGHQRASNVEQKVALDKEENRLSA